MNVAEATARARSEFSGTKNSHGVMLMPMFEDEELTSAIEDSKLDTKIRDLEKHIKAQDKKLVELKC